jgi:hypothetical protein
MIRSHKLDLQLVQFKLRLGAGGIARRIPPVMFSNRAADYALLIRPTESPSKGALTLKEIPG